MKKYLALALLLSLFTITNAFAGKKNNTIKGTVYENSKNNDAPLSMAYVYVDNSIYCTYTNNDGSFELNLPKGKYEIKIAFKGYGTKSQTIVVKNKPINLNFTLQQEQNQLATK